MTNLPRRRPVLDPDHPAVSCADDQHSDWVGQFDFIFGKDHEIERLAFYRTAFRRQWMGDPMFFFLKDYLKEGAPAPINVKEWLFLWSAWAGHWRACKLKDLVDDQRRIEAIACLVQPMTPKILSACREANQKLYQEIALALWQYISSQVRYEDRFIYHPGGGGRYQSFVSARSRQFDRFLMVWPIESDPLLEPILIAVGDWWEAWKKSQSLDDNGDAYSTAN